jgi:hypothetical protein
VILRILPSAGKVTIDAFDTAGARNAPQLGVKALFHHAIVPMLHVDFVRFVQIHPLGRKYAAC